jgi:hypothetical protein
MNLSDRLIEIPSISSLRGHIGKFLEAISKLGPSTVTKT